MCEPVVDLKIRMQLHLVCGKDKAVKAVERVLLKAISLKVHSVWKSQVCNVSRT